MTRWTWCALGLLVNLAFMAMQAAAATPPPVQPPKGAPEYLAPPRPTDGANMALTVEKLEKGLDPERPLLIWAIGSSFTNGLGNGDLLSELVHQRFPNAPKFVYKKIAGNSTSYLFSHGWARHLVIPDQPDVVLLYNYGKTEDLENMIAELRRSTTADIIVPTIHWTKQHKKVWGDPEAPNSHQDPKAMRAMCAKYGVEFVENRLEMNKYMVDNKLEMEDLLGDSVHESRYAARMTVMNIARHFNRAARFNYDPRSRERRVEATSPAVERGSGKWTVADGSLATKEPGSSISVQFTGSRIDLVGWRGPDGGTAEVFIDGKPASQADVFYAGYLEPAKGNALLPPNPPRDRSPHGIQLGTKLVPQTWTLTLVSDKSDFELVGSVTGPDGRGNGLKPFTSNSGQIILDPKLWRDAKNNKTGDRFTFEVYRSALGTVDFKAAEAKKFGVRLACNLPNGPHTVKLVARGDGVVRVSAFDVFEPPRFEAR